MTRLVVGDQLIDFLATQPWLMDVLPSCGSILRAGVVEERGCGGCPKAPGQKARVRSDSRERFKDCLTHVGDLQPLKQRLGATQLTLYLRSSGTTQIVTR